MSRELTLKHEFVEVIPDELESGTIYVAMEFGTVVHSCCCGCGNKVVTPLSPTDWKLIYDGETISLEPSIGNWGFDCQSHYWIIRNGISWAGKWLRNEVEAGRVQDKIAKENYFGGIKAIEISTSTVNESENLMNKPLPRNIWLRFWFRLFNPQQK